jgi:hypothetical protein
MTYDQIEEIIGVPDAGFAPYQEIRYIIVEKDKKVIIPLVEEKWLKFDVTNEILEVAIARLYSKNGEEPNHVNFRKIGNNVYEFLTDRAGNQIIDYYPFGTIVMIKVQEV